MDISWVISSLIFIMVLLGSVGLYLTIGSRESMRVIKRRAEGNTGVSASDDDPIGESLKGRLHSLLTCLGEANKPSDRSEVSAIREALYAAGYRHAQAPILFMGAKFLFSILALLFMILIPNKVLGFPTVSTHLFMYVCAASAGYFLPMLWLRYATGKRKEKLLDAFPDALDLMVVCVEA